MVLQCNIYVTNAWNYFSVDIEKSFLDKREADENCAYLLLDGKNDKFYVGPTSCIENQSVLCYLDLDIYPYE